MNSRFEVTHDLKAAREFLAAHLADIKGLNAIQAKDKLRALDNGADIFGPALDRAIAEHYGILPQVEQAGWGFQITYIRG